MISDALNPSLGAQSMRYALLLVTIVVLPWAAFHYFRAGRTIDADLDRATEAD